MDIMDHLAEPKQLQDLILISSFNNSCDLDQSIIQHNCYKNNQSDAKCAKGLIRLIVEVIASKPDLLDEEVMECLISRLESSTIRITNLISHDILIYLQNGSSPSQARTWLKYENLIIKLIRRNIYDTETMANEILCIVRREIEPQVAQKFSSVLSSCVKVCRETSKNTGQEGGEEKWCEIIDWMSWFLGSEGGDLEV